jgi:hypothetical protein
MEHWFLAHGKGGLSNDSTKLMKAGKDEYFECIEQDINENNEQVLSIWHGIGT